MKILHTVEFYSPSVGGMQEVVRQLSERLVKFGHEVTVATTKLPARSDHVINGVKIEEFDIKGNLVSGMTGEVERYQKFLLDSEFDVITNFAAQQWATDCMLTMLEKVEAKKIFVPTGFSCLYSTRYKNYFRSMKRWMKHYDMNIFLSDNYRDINFARENDIKKTVLIPNGAGEDEFLAENHFDVRAKLGIAKTDFLILHVGSHTGLKGHAEAIDIFASARINGATLLIIGNDFGGGCKAECTKKEQLLNGSRQFQVDDKRLIVTSLSRTETIAAYKSADLFLFPSNIECSPIVLFECMASRTPFLTSKSGNAAEIVEWSSAGVILPTTDKVQAKGFYERLKYGLSKLLPLQVTVGEDLAAVKVDIPGSIKILESVSRSRERLQSMSETGFEAWKTRFTWEKIATQYEELYVSLMSR